ncbi:ribonuclease R [Alicyclobacillus sp. ALC3]|uniref:ribonuclease R n=1 Tax=Alicyclobacillus sp. ALC3 TaxID=2796143 RepID=UPI002378F0B5|nr:ribonuclease R [Alicyclobacillus sp. ALC3]
MKESLIEYMRHDAYRPLTVQELAEAFEVEGGDGFRDFIKLLNQLEEAGEVVRTRANRYGVPERMNLVVGRLQVKARGYGFCQPEAPGEPDVYVPASDMNGALPNDKVMVRIEKTSGGGSRREGKVIRILERGADRVVGKFTRHRTHGFVTPLDKRFPQDVFIATEDALDAHDGFVVVAEITEYPTTTRGPEGRVVEVLGHPDAPGVDILGVVRKYGLPEAFPEEVLRAAELIPIELSEQDFEGRRDLRDEVIVTIDGEDAKDLDDAVQVEQLENGNYLLGVHIADVGYYVKENSALDKEAFKRGTSVYLVDRVIPMLPQRLSNNICSLNPQVDRLTLSCMMEITPAGEVTRHDVFPSVIKTAERMTYANVRRILVERDEELIERYKPLVPMFERMEELADILNKMRMRRGAIDFDFDEVKVVVDDEGHTIDIVPRPRSVAERIIEEFMLAANETVAEHFHWLDVPFIYRIHEEPTLEKMMEYNEFIHNFGYHVKGLGNHVKPRALQDILEKAEGTREQRVIATLMLRSMRQARYSPECVGHFGLAAEYYTHFTSPIRRYPDLCIHRIIREALRGPLPETREQKLREFVESASIQSSERERVAQDAERECDQLKMVEFMQEHVGEEFDGIVSGVTQFGLFVQLQNGVEGLIHVSYLNDDYYVYNERHLALVGERTRRVFRLGDPIRVEVAGASKENLTIDFSLVAHHREGTMVDDDGGEMVIYDEDLEAGARKRAIRQRSERRRERGHRSDDEFSRGDRHSRRDSARDSFGRGNPGRGDQRDGDSAPRDDRFDRRGKRPGADKDERRGDGRGSRSPGFANRGSRRPSSGPADNRGDERGGRSHGNGRGESSPAADPHNRQAGSSRAATPHNRHGGQPVGKRKFNWAERNRKGGYGLDPSFAEGRPDTGDGENRDSRRDGGRDEQAPRVGDREAGPGPNGNRRRRRSTKSHGNGNGNGERSTTGGGGNGHGHGGSGRPAGAGKNSNRSSAFAKGGVRAGRKSKSKARSGLH